MWDTWVARFGSVTQLLLWTCVAAFLLRLICDFVGFDVNVLVPAPFGEGSMPIKQNVMDYVFGLTPHNLWRGFVWQPLTYMFLHAGLFHILFNLLILWFMGREVEYFIGPKYFLRLYFLGGIVGGLFWLAFNFQSGVPLVGASAAVLACVIAFATLFPDREITFLLWFILPVRIKAKYLAAILVAFDIVPILQRTGGDVAHLAHLGGAALGYVYIKHLGYGRMPRWLEIIESMAAKLKPKRSTPISDSPRRKPRVDISPEAYIREQVDPILEKISREGMQSLTRDERKILESAQDLLKKRQR